jgi:hypothetical protein
MPAAQSSNPGRSSGTVWRMVEAQNRVSTLKLVDDLDEQATLEALLDASKPPVPSDCQHLHWLLFTPFRYQARGDSRFRRAGPTPGVFYAAEAIETAVAEIAFWRLLFFLESPATPWPANPLEMTGFAVGFETPLCLDLAAPPYNEASADWLHPTNYSACHSIADEARRLGCGAIRSPSARDPNGGLNISLLTCAAFAEPTPLAYQTWRIRLSDAGVNALSEAPVGRLHFPMAAFAGDPRVAARLNQPSGP